MGVSLADPDRDFLQALKLEGKRGALATQVFLNSPAEKGGIRPGDFITHVNGREARGMNQVTMMLADLKPGDQATVTVIRDEASQNFTVRIEARTEAATDAKNVWPGLYVVQLTDALRDNLKLDKNAQGLYVAQIINETPSAIIDLQRGDCITGINGEPVNDIASFYRVLRDKIDTKLWFNITRGNETVETLTFTSVGRQDAAEATPQAPAAREQEAERLQVVEEAQQQEQLSLDGAITQAVKAVEARLATGAKLAVLNFSSPSEAFSDYVIEELSGALVMNNKVTVIERRSLDLIRKEMNLQLSGDVSDESAMSIGKQLGAQAIVTGSLTNLGDVYRFRVKIINVETARIETQVSYNMGNDRRVTFLLQGDQQSTPAVAATSPVVKPASGAGTPAAVVPTLASTANEYKIGGTGPAGGVVFYPAARTENTKPAPVTRDYKIGDMGPADGTIFYVNPSAGDWKYLEAAPAKTEVKTFWASEAFPIDGILGVRAVGTGKSNTEFIMRQAVSKGGGFDWAAEACDSLTVNGYDDWFLPSQDELNMMYGNLGRKGLGDFKAEWYWSSTPYKGDWGEPARAENFSDGALRGDYESQRYDRNRKYCVRAIRQF
jgi:TolB-like protein